MCYLRRNWDILTDFQASNGKYVTVKAGMQSLDNPPSSEEKPVCTIF